MNILKIFNKNIINIIVALIFICLFVLLTEKINNKIKKYLQDYKVQLIIVIFILIITYYHKYSGILLFILFSLQYNLAIKEYFTLGDTKETYYNNMINSINKSINYNIETGHSNNETHINEVNRILRLYLGNKLQTFTNTFDKHQKNNPRQIIMI